MNPGPRRLVLALLISAAAGRTSTSLGQAAPASPPWNELDSSWASVRLGAAVMEDGAFYSQDAANKEQVGQLTSEGLFRVDELSLSGQIKFPRPWRYEVAGNYKGLDPTSARSWTLTYAFLTIPVGSLGSVTIGKQKEGAGLELSENGRDIPFMERSTMSTTFAFINSHIVGVRFFGEAAAGRMAWSAGWFNNWLDDGLSFDQSGNVFTGRVTGLAVEADGGRRLLHLGTSFGYREAPNGAFQLKSVPEVYEAPDFVDTGSFPATSGSSVAGEIVAVEGPVTVSGEYSWTRVDSPQSGNPRFSGYYAMVSWALTGEARPYDHASGTFGAISPAAPFSFKHGGCGAWEVAARWSSVDLTSGSVQGGKFDRLSGALSWRPTSQVRFEFDYGYGRLDRDGLRGRSNFYQLRLQFQL